MNSITPVQKLNYFRDFFNEIPLPNYSPRNVIGLLYPEYNQNKYNSNEIYKIWEKHLKTESCNNLELYINIPFCQSRCNYCLYSGLNESYKAKKIGSGIRRFDLIGEKC